uniref:Conserved hypothetical plastid protein n=1 Tax=Flintiella sanguinaria TaxID=101926 RepID=A0A1X9PUB5_9RHOD|nr:conserved hypothetical plastid protein [Flintiella sanguinaria]
MIQEIDDKSYDEYDFSTILKNLNTNEQIEKIEQINRTNKESVDIFIKFLRNRKYASKEFPNHIDGLVYEILYKKTCLESQTFLEKEFSRGILPLDTTKNIDYYDLQKLLVEKKFQEADQITQTKLRQLADLKNREWLYFTDVQKIPSIDLNTIDKLWRIHSLDKFGFSIQRRIWLQFNKDWNALWNNIGWQTNNNPCRYPNEFVWDVTGPKGHLPLFNQLRGVQVLSALFKHELWKNE